MKILRNITIILVIIIMIIGQFSFVYATEVVDERGQQTELQYNQEQRKNGEINPYNYKPTNENQGETYKNKVGIILGVIRAIGIIVSVGALIVIGIKMMLGSIEEKSIIKQALPGYIIGALLVMSMTTLPSIIYKIASKF